MLADLFPAARLTAIDIAPAMLEQARKNAGNRVAFLLMDGEQPSFPDTFDLITASTTFQWFRALPAALKSYYSLLEPDGILAFSIFGSGTLAEFSALLPPGYYIGQKLPTAEELQQLLSAAGFFDCTITTRVFIRHCSGIKEFFRSLKKLGARRANLSDRPKLLPPKKLLNLFTEYDIKYNSDQGVKVYHELHFVHAKKQGLFHNRH